MHVAYEDRNTHSTEDGPEGHKSLNVVGQVSAVGVPVRVFASLQDKLLSLEIMMFITHPAEESKSQGVNTPIHKKKPNKSDSHALLLAWLLSKSQYAEHMLTDVIGLYSNTHSRATLHTDGADVVKATLLNVAAL